MINNEFKKVNKDGETHYILESDSATISTGVVATVPKALGKVQKRSLVSQEGKKEETPKPRKNPVAKHVNATVGGGGAGAHKDRKKAMKRGEMKHKARELDVAEGSEFGAYYYEQLAQQTFDINPNLQNENEILNLGYKIAKGELGSRAQGMFRDEDFPSDFVSAYSYLKKQGVAEGSEQIYKVVALDKGNALKKPTKMKVKADSIEDLFSRLAANDWYPLEINGVEVIAGKRLKQGVAEGSDYTPPKLGTVRANIMINADKPTVQVQVFKHNTLRGDSYWVTKEVRTFKTKALAQAYVDRINKQGVAEGGGFVDVTGWSDRDVQRLGHQDDPEGDAWQQRQDARPKIVAWTFYDVKPGQEDTAAMYKIRQMKNGKWAMPEYDKSGRTYAFQRNEADKVFGPGKRWVPKNEGVAEASLATTLAWPEIVNKVSGAMKAMGWKVQRKGDDGYMFSTKGQETEDQWYIVIIENEGEGTFHYALGTVEEGDPHIGESGSLPNTLASVSELMDSIREGYGLAEGNPVNVHALMARGDRSGSSSPWWARAGDLNYMGSSETSKELTQKIYFPKMFTGWEFQHHFDGDQAKAEKAADDLGFEQDEDGTWYFPVYKKLNQVVKNRLTRAKYLFGDHKRVKVSKDETDEDHSTVGANGKPFGAGSYSGATAQRLGPGKGVDMEIPEQNEYQKSLSERLSQVLEMPIRTNPEDPMDPEIYGHQGVNPSTLKGRMMRAKGQLKDLAQRAESGSALDWEQITKHWPEISMNIEQIRHGIEELVKVRKKGGVKSRGIDKHIGESTTDNPEYSDEVGYVKDNIHTIVKACKELLDTMVDNENLPDWVQEKIAQAKGMLVASTDYLMSQHAQGNVYTNTEEDSENVGSKQWMSDYELEPYIPDNLQDEWFTMLGYDEDGNVSARWSEVSDEEPDSRNPNHRRLMVQVANNFISQHNLPFAVSNVKDNGDDLSWLVQMKPKSGMNEVAPKGWEGTVKAMKKHKDIDNPWALAHWMKNKGYKSHKKEDAYMQELFDKLSEKMPANAPVDAWVQDFQKADPEKYHQFRQNNRPGTHKPPEKIAQMAAAASYAAKNPSKKK